MSGFGTFIDCRRRIELSREPVAQHGVSSTTCDDTTQRNRDVACGTNQRINFREIPNHRQRLFGQGMTGLIPLDDPYARESVVVRQLIDPQSKVCRDRIGVCSQTISSVAKSRSSSLQENSPHLAAPFLVPLQQGC